MLCSVPTAQSVRDFNFEVISGLNSNDESGELRRVEESDQDRQYCSSSERAGEQLQTSYQHRKYLETKVYTTH